MLVIDSDASLDSATPGAADVLADLATHRVDIDVPTVALAAARRAKNLKNATGISMRARGSSGRWFRLHAARSATTRSPSSSSPRVQPTSSPSSSSPTASPNASPRWCHFSPGDCRPKRSPRRCASRANTVNDHIKTIFSKCDVTSRGELVARLFADHILEHHHAATTHR